MKIGRNDPCPCGSGKKYKRCCLDASSRISANIAAELEQALAMNPGLSIDELNLIAQHKISEHNNRPNENFFGLSASQISNWLYAPFKELTGVNIRTPQDVSNSPVMRYLSLIIDEAIKQNGSIKATARGYLPVKLVKQAEELLPELAACQFESASNISEFSGSIESKFNALHYTRILAELSGIINLKNGRFHLAQTVQAQYQTQGIRAFFLPMLETTVDRYNWGYFDLWPDDLNLRTFWLFMTWRIQHHGSLELLIDEVSTAFPDFPEQFPNHSYLSRQKQLAMLIESRFIVRFLQFWGFIAFNRKIYFESRDVSQKMKILPLLKQSFEFPINSSSKTQSFNT